MTSLFKIIAFTLLIKTFLIIYDFIMIVIINFFSRCNARALLLVNYKGPLIHACIYRKVGDFSPTLLLQVE